MVNGHVLTMPNSYDKPFMENTIKSLGKKKHAEWKREMLKKDEKNIVTLERLRQPRLFPAVNFLPTLFDH